MKLYTEDQVRVAMSMSFLKDYEIASTKQIIESLKSIELPSDEEIWEKIEDSTYSLEYDTGFAQGVKWVVEQIKQQDNA